MYVEQLFSHVINFLSFLLRDYDINKRKSLTILFKVKKIVIHFQRVEDQPHMGQAEHVCAGENVVRISLLTMRYLIYSCLGL